MPIEVIYLENVGIFIDIMSENVVVGQIMEVKGVDREAQVSWKVRIRLWRTDGGGQGNRPEG